VSTGLQSALLDLQFDHAAELLDIGFLQPKRQRDGLGNR
jgi:hypothetical protein